MKKENKEKIPEWISELGELIAFKYNKEHKAFLSKPTKGIDGYVRKPYGGKK